MTSKRRKWLILLLGLAATIGVMIGGSMLLARKPEPIHNGKTVSEWAVIYYHDQLKVTPLGGEGGEALRAFGTNAVPRLLELAAFEPRHPKARLMVGQLLLKLPFVSSGGTIWRWCKSVPEQNLALAASAAFGVLGTNAQPAIPELVRLMNSTNSPVAAFNATSALGAIGEPAVPALLAQLANTNAPNRAGVALTFAFYLQRSTNNTQVVIQLLSCLHDPDPKLVEASAFALGVMAQSPYRPQADLIVPTLIERLPRTTGSTQTSLLQALSAYGAHARDAVPVLREMLNDQHESVRSGAANALQAIAPEAPTNVSPR